MKLLSMSAFAIFGIVLIVSESAAALTTTSPNYSGPPIAPLENAASAGVNRSQHYIIASHTSNDGYQVDIAAYMSNYNPNRRIQLYRTSPSYDLFSGNQCKISNAPGVTDSTNVLQVSMGGAGLTPVNYNIRKDQACVAPYTNTRANAANSRFWGTYQLPAGTPVLDAETGLYKINISIRFTSAITSSDQDYSSAMVFRARLLAAPADDVLPGGAFVGTIASGGGANPRGVGSITLTPSTDREYYRHYFDFGSPCSQTANVERVVTIRDPDNYANSPPGALSSTQGGGVNSRSGPRPLRVQVLENGLPLAASRYTSVVRGSVAGYPTAGSSAWVRPTSSEDSGGQSQNTTIRFAMIPGGKYRLVVLDAYYLNILQVQLPTDASYNAITCPPDDYELEPSMTSTPDIIYPGTNTVGPVEGRLNNSGTTPNAQQTLAGIARFVVRSNRTFTPDPKTGGTVSGVSTAAGYSCRIAQALPSPASTECTNLWEGSYAAGNLTVGDRLMRNIASVDLSSISPGLAVGDRICFVAVVNRYNVDQTSTDWRYSDVVCVTVAKIPFVHVWGNDIRVGSSWETTGNQTSKIAGLTLLSGANRVGSRGEYSVIAPGVVNGVASGYSRATNDTDRNRLTFRNTGSYGNFATAGSMGALPGVFEYFFRDGVISAANRKTELDVDLWSNTSSVGTQNNVTNTRVYYTSGNMTLTGTGIRLADTWNASTSTPQVVIIADGNITINSTVTRVDAWLVSRNGTIITCQQPGTNSSQCQNRLDVNGPIMARYLNLKRTAGNDNVATLDQPAERLNLPASTYIWSKKMQEDNSTLRSTYTRELPPRF